MENAFSGAGMLTPCPGYSAQNPLLRTTLGRVTVTNRKGINSKSNAVNCILLHSTVDPRL